MFEKLAVPIKIGSVTLSNRLVAQVTVHNLATEDGFATDRLVAQYSRRGCGGWGLVNVEASFVRQDGSNFNRMLGIHTDQAIAGLNEIAEAIHEGGAAASIQLMHGGRTAWYPKIIGNAPVGPSDVTRAEGSAGLGTLTAFGVKPRALSLSEVEQIIDDFVAAAARAQQAGFDMVMLHGAHGFLISQFMSPFLNTRRDIYGEDPARFAIEIVTRIKQQLGRDFPVVMRISGDEFLGDQGVRLGDILEMVPRLEQAGVDCFDVSAGGVESGEWCIQPLYFPRGCIVHLATAVKKVVKVPVVTSGRINNPILAESIIGEGKADMVGICRGTVADPDFARKALSGRPDEIRECIGCDVSCIGRLGAQKSVMCAINYAYGRSKSEFDLIPALKQKKVLVIGGGVAGMEAARVAVGRGHEVRLLEKRLDLGGAVRHLASAIPRLYTGDLANIVHYLLNQMQKLGIPVQTGVQLTRSIIEEWHPDAVIVATGSRAGLPQLSVHSGPLLITLDEYLMNRPEVGQTVLVVGGGHGCETAVSLSREQKKVILVEETAELASTPYLVGTRKQLLLKMVDEGRIRTFTQARVDRVEGRQVRIGIGAGAAEDVEVDTVIFALDRVPNTEILSLIPESVPEIHCIGDCRQPKNIMHAIHSANLVARGL